MLTRICIFLVFCAGMCGAAEPRSFDTSWITDKPEVLTYRTSGKEGDGLYQLSVWKTPDGIEAYINMITSGFTKSVSGTFAADFRPRESKSRIIVNGQITMTTDCAYKPDRLHIATLMMPYNQVVENTLPVSDVVVDFSQAPFLPRILALRPGAEFIFSSLNPQSNSLVPLSIRVTGEEIIHGSACFRIEGNDFEGRSTYWIEKDRPHRVMRIEQTGRVTELILAP